MSAGKFFQPNLIALLPSGAVVLSKWAFAFFNGIEEHPKNEMLGEDGKTLSKWELALLLDGSFSPLIDSTVEVALSRWQR